MDATCLSVCGPCKEVCKTCIDSHERYLTNAEEMLVRHAKTVLTSRGYVVIPRERHVVLTVSSVLPPHPARLKIGKERLADMMQTQQAHQFGRALFDGGVVVNRIRPLSDPVTGDEEVFESTIGLIKPKAHDEV